MKILEEKVELGTVQVVLTENDRLQVKLVNDKDEFLGSLFASEEGVSKTFKRFTDKELTEEQMKLVEDAMDKVEKAESTPIKASSLAKFLPKAENTDEDNKEEKEESDTTGRDDLGKSRTTVFTDDNEMMDPKEYLDGCEEEEDGENDYIRDENGKCVKKKSRDTVEIKEETSARVQRREARLDEKSETSQRTKRRVKRDEKYSPAAKLLKLKGESKITGEDIESVLDEAFDKGDIKSIASTKSGGWRLEFKNGYVDIEKSGSDFELSPDEGKSIKLNSKNFVEKIEEFINRKS